MKASFYTKVPFSLIRLIDLKVAEVVVVNFLFVSTLYSTVCTSAQARRYFCVNLIFLLETVNVNY